MIDDGGIHSREGRAGSALAGAVILLVAGAFVAVGAGFLAHGAWLLFLYGWGHL